MRRSGAAAVLLLGLGLGACSDDDAGGSAAVAITEPWGRTTPPGVTIGAVYLQLESDRDDALVGASVDPAVAASAGLHMTMAAGDTSMTGTTADAAGEVTMHGVPAIEIPAGETVALEPGSFHIMLVDLVDPLEAGETFNITLDFEETGEQVVPVEVRDDAP